MSVPEFKIGSATFTKAAFTGLSLEQALKKYQRKDSRKVTTAYKHFYPDKPAKEVDRAVSDTKSEKK